MNMEMPKSVKEFVRVFGDVTLELAEVFQEDYKHSANYGYWYCEYVGKKGGFVIHTEVITLDKPENPPKHIKITGERDSERSFFLFTDEEDKEPINVTEDNVALAIYTIGKYGNRVTFFE